MVLKNTLLFSRGLTSRVFSKTGILSPRISWQPDCMGEKPGFGAKEKPRSSDKPRYSVLTQAATRFKGKKTTAADRWPLILQGNDSVGLFNHINMTTTDYEIVKKFMNIAQLTPDKIEESDVIYGSGLLQYTGSMWYDESIFIGKSSTNRHLIRVINESGLKILRNALKDSLIVEAFREISVTQVSFYLSVNAPVNLKTTDTWIRESATSVRNCSAEKTLVYLEKSSIKIGQRGSSRSITIEPLLLNNKMTDFQKIVFKAVFTNNSAMQFLSGLTDLSNQSGSLMAFMIHDSLKFVGVDDPFLDHIRSALNLDYKLGSIVVKQVRKTNKTRYPAELKHAQSSCTALINKAVVSNYSSLVYDLLKEKLFTVLFERQEEIPNYKTLTADLAKFLQEQSDKQKTSRESKKSTSPS